MLRKNVASQVVTFNLVNATTGAALTGATVTVKVTLDGTQSGGAGTVTELGTGQYKYVPTQGETNGSSVGFSFTATNAVPVNLHAFTMGFDPTLANWPANLVQILATTLTETAGQIAAGFKKVFDVASPVFTAASVNQSADNNTKLADIQTRLPAALTSGGNMKAGVQGFLDSVFTEGATGRIAAAFKQFFNIASPAATMDHGILVDTATTLTNAPSDSLGVTTLLGKLTGITLLKEWLGLIAGKQVGNTTARNELRGTGAGSGSFDETTDSLEAVRDRGDAAYTTFAGGAVASVTAPVTVGTNNDKTGYALTSGERTAIANEVEAQIIDETDSEKVLTAITDKIASVNPSLGSLTLAAIAAAVRDQAYAGASAGSIGKALGDLAARLPGAGTLAIATDVPTAAANAAAVRDVSNASPAASSLGAGIKAVSDRAPGSGTLTVTTDIPTAAQNATQVRTELGAELARIDVATSTRAPESGGNLAAVKAKTDNLPSDPADESLIEAATTAVLTAVNALNNLSAAQVKAQVVAALTTDTYAEPWSIPASTASLKDMLAILTALALNKSTLATDGSFALRNRADSANIGTRTDTDDGTIYTRGKVA